MKIAVFGTGIVGRVIAGKLESLGHEVIIGTRDVKATLASEQKDNYGNPPFKDWIADHKNIKLLSFREAAANAQLIFNCTLGSHSVEAIRQAGDQHINGKILIDVSNPLDFTNGFPPALNPVNTDSLGELIQRTFPSLRVVKTLNTMNCYLMVDPKLVAGDHSVFLSGNDAGAKSDVASILKSFGWIEKNIIDLGDITTARGTEQLLPIWIRLYSKFKDAMFNFNVVRG